MAYLWLFIVFLLSAGLFILGYWLAQRDTRGSILGVTFGWIGVVSALLITLRPEYEYHLLACDSYIYLRDAVYLPFAAILAGAAIPRVHPRSGRALAALLAVTAAAATYQYGWGIPSQRFEGLRARWDRWGICHNSLPETSGVAACATVARLYGSPVSEGWMARESLVRPRQGTDVIGLFHGLREALAGTECIISVQRLTWRDLMQRPSPSVLILRENGWQTQAVVCYSMDLRGVVLGHPRYGLMVLPLDRVLQAWSGRAIIVDPPFYLQPSRKPPAWI